MALLACLVPWACRPGRPARDLIAWARWLLLPHAAAGTKEADALLELLAILGGNKLCAGRAGPTEQGFEDRAALIEKFCEDRAALTEKLCEDRAALTKKPFL